MRLVGRNALYTSFLKRTLRPRPPPAQQLRRLTLPIPVALRYEHERGDSPRHIPNPNAKDIAILGGGITGLATAWYASQYLPNARITIYEKNNRLGGWVDSEVVQVDQGTVLFEWGPRTLRPDLRGPGLATAKLVCPPCIAPLNIMLIQAI